ncbi:sensor histidine kinase [Nitriliruptor alkaliphilus]|uniref:sensor histidine kinase n=1 Tax=Nitriliruptor alkaliphilus TaxID=427918 RepID=UPI000696435E|nr:histidine kinase [Nitriliruptor alkaliphilus]
MGLRVLTPASTTARGTVAAWYERQVQRWLRSQASALGAADRLEVAAGRVACEVWPRWLLPVEVLGLGGLGVLAVIELWESPVAVALLVAALVPWVAWDLDAPVPPWLLGTLTIVPFAVINLAGGQLGVSSLGDDGPMFTLALLALFAVHVGVLTARPAGLVALSVALLAIPAGRWLIEPTFTTVPVYLGALVLSLVAGALLGKQARLVFQLGAAQDALVDEATARERKRIAREVHDVIAHSMAVTMLHVTGARLANEQGRSDEVRAALLDAERLGRESLNEVRRTVGLLRDDTTSPTSEALPGTADVAELIATHRDVGMAVTARLDDGLDDVTGTVGLTAYRLVQESLTNAAKHAPNQPVDLDLALRDDEVVLRVVNALPHGAATEDHRSRGSGGGVGGGVGLRGMAERVAQLDGSLTFGPVDGRWDVVARLPVTDPSPVAP